MTDWTTPTTAAPNDVITSALWNSDVRDNSLHLKEHEIAIESDTDSTGASTSSTSYQTSEMPSQEVTISVTCSVLLILGGRAKVSNQNYGCIIQLFRDSTEIGLPIDVATEDWSGVCVLGVDASLGADTYTFSAKFKSGNASGTAYIDDMTLVVIPIPD